MDEQKAKKAIIFGQYGRVKTRLDAVTEFRGAVTGHSYFWHKPGMALMMDVRDHAAAFPEQQVKPKQEEKNG